MSFGGVLPAFLPVGSQWFANWRQTVRQMLPEYRRPLPNLTTRSEPGCQNHVRTNKAMPIFLD
jgi:hypothetical protein